MWRMRFPDVPDRVGGRGRRFTGSDERRMREELVRKYLADSIIAELPEKYQ
jgi:hypothetical protein